jgi:lipoprotein-anchoring transpeptidase ErfK/SrfK
MAQAAQQPAPERGRARRRAKKRRSRRWPFNRYTPRAVLIGVGLGLVTFVLLGVMMVVGAYGYFQVFGLIVPGVHVGGVKLGGMSVEEASLALDEAWNVEQGGIILTDGQRSWYAPPSDFGLALDPVATARRASDVGHGESVIGEMVTMIDSTLNGTPVEPVVQVDAEAARAGLEDWAEKIDLLPQDASIRIEGGEVVAVPGVPGYTLDVEGTLAALVAAPGLALIDGYLPLVLVPVAPRVADAGDAAADAERLLASDLSVEGYDPITDEHLQWTASREEIASWLAVVEGEDGPEVVVGEERLAAYLDELSASLGEGRYFDAQESAGLLEAALREESGAALIVRHTPTTYTVGAGDTLTSISWDVGMPYWRILDANPGLDSETLTVGQVLTIPSKDDLLPLPVVVNKRMVVSINRQRLWTYQDGELLHEYVISTGIDRSPTQPGVFQVQTHEPLAYASVWDLTMPHFLGIYESWPGFMNGFHGLPSRDGGQVLWAASLGRKTSFGCIILDLDDAEALYNWADEGVVVEIAE